MYRQLKVGKRAIRIRRAKEPLLLTFCSAAVAAAATEESESPNSDGDFHGDCSNFPTAKTTLVPDLVPDMKMDLELYEGIVSQPIIEPTVSETRILTCVL